MPNSLLWIGLVAVWLFVLVPMLVTKRPRIRQTTDAALATRFYIAVTRSRRPPAGPRQVTALIRTGVRVVITRTAMRRLV